MLQKMTQINKEHDPQHVMNIQKKAEESDTAMHDYNPLQNVTCKIGNGSCAAKHASAIQRSNLFHPMNENQKVQSLMRLQQQYGNRFVRRVVAQNAIQTKLKVGQPGDIYEQEADRVANTVMNMPEPQIRRQAEDEEEQVQTKPIAGQITPYIQKQVNEEEEETPQAKVLSRRKPTVSPASEANINNMKGSGSPLPESVGSFFGSRFGYDFSHVRVHTDTRAAETARTLNARAFTVGHNIVFGSGQYAPEKSSGKNLLAHELTHVVQQSGSNGLHVGQVGEKRGLTPIDNTIQKAVPSRAPAATAARTANITLETGNIGAGFLNNLVHQQICVDKYGPDSRKRCFSFAAIGAQLPQFSRKWLGWNSWVVGAILKGEVYEPSPVSGATVVSRHTPTPTQGATWLNYMLGTRLGLQDGYSVARHNCRKFSQWEFRDAPSHW